MITLRWGQERHHETCLEEEGWATFRPQERDDPLADGFGALELLNEDWLPPGAGVRRRARVHTEVVTYVREGTLACSDSSGGSGVLRAGGFRCMPAGPGMSHDEINASPTDGAHFFQVWLRHSGSGVAPSQDQLRFSAAERRGQFRVVATPNGRGGSLCLNLDATIYSALIEPGQRLVHQLPPGRRAWLHVVQGEMMIGKVLLTTGDGAGVTAEQEVVVAAQEKTEVLLVDLDAADPPRTD